MSKFTRLPLRELTNPQKCGVLQVYKDHWWAVDDEENVFFFKGKSYSPQCNINKHLVERHLAIEDGVAQATRAILVPWAYVNINISDYV